MEEQKKKRRLPPWVITALCGLCAVIWLYLGLFRWEEDRFLALFVGVIWLVSAVAWGFRARNPKREEEDEP